MATILATVHLNASHFNISISYRMQHLVSKVVRPLVNTGIMGKIYRGNKLSIGPSGEKQHTDCTRGGDPDIVPD